MRGSFKRGNPQDLDALAGGRDQGGFGGETERLPSRIERYGRARRVARETLSYIDAALIDKGQLLYHQGEIALLRKKALELRDCGNYLHFRNYYTVDAVRLHAASFCRVHLLCPLCAIRRGSKALGAYLDRFRVIQATNLGIRFSMVTYTVKNGPDLLQRFDHLKDCLSAVMKRRRNARGVSRHKTEWEKVLGVVGSFEVKRGKNSGEWHPHCHMIVLHTERMDAKAMREEWERITGDSKVFHIAPARHPREPERDFVEVFKYAVKFSDMTRADNVEAFLKLQGRRFLFSAGEFWGVKVPDDLTDGGEGLEGLPFIDLFYRYLEGVGYSLAATGKPHEWTLTEHANGNEARLLEGALRRSRRGG